MATFAHGSWRPGGTRRRPSRALALTVSALLISSVVTAFTAPSVSAASATAQPASAQGHQDNPYSGAVAYVNPHWSARAAAEPGGERIAGEPTAVWLDSVASIEAPAGSGYAASLRRHLDNALAQGATLAQFVLHNLPSRDCLNQQLAPPADPAAMDRYKHDYIDPIAAIEADPKYSSLRIVNIIEPGSLGTAVRASFDITSACEAAVVDREYQTGVAYALGALHRAGSNTYQYLDASHHGQVGWDTTFFPAAQVLAETAQAASGGSAAVDGFITNTADYAVVSEPYFSATTQVAGTGVWQSKWVDWNDYVDESSFATALRSELVARGFDPGVGMLIDTSRNGWGGPARPTRASVSTDVNTYVNQSRLDRRITISNWCNQSGAGLGERPRPAPSSGIDAYVWAKPPGESDGTRSTVPTGPGNPAGKRPDRMCDPDYTGPPRGSSSQTGALPDAPAFGAWFPSQFQQLMSNAYPPLTARGTS